MKSFNDFKEFNIDGTKVGLGQSLCKSIEEFEALKDVFNKQIEIIFPVIICPNGIFNFIYHTFCIIR